ncbi:unnamed protein product, partial [Prorocentrum cordatum]
QVVPPRGQQRPRHSRPRRPGSPPVAPGVAAGRRGAACRARPGARHPAARRGARRRARRWARPDDGRAAEGEAREGRPARLWHEEGAHQAARGPRSRARGCHPSASQASACPSGHRQREWRRPRGRPRK